MTRTQLVSLAALTLAASACRPDSPGIARSMTVVGSPSVMLVTQVVIQEPESLYLAAPRALALTEDGDFYVADGASERVVRYDRSGAPKAVVGRRGSGPGEFREIGLILPLSDGRVMISDVALRRLSFFDQKSGKPLSYASYQGIAFHGQAGSNSIWLGALNMERRTGVARYRGGDSISEYMVPIPREYESGGPLAGIFSGVAVAAWGDTLLVAFAGSDRMYVVDTLGQIEDSIIVPARFRRGVPPHAYESFTPEHSQSDMFAALSEFYGLHRLPSGRILAAHRDLHINGRVVTATLFVSIISPDLRAACVDARIPSTGDGPVVANFKGDTIFVLDQRADSTDHLVSRLLGYVLDDTDCAW